MRRRILLYSDSSEFGGHEAMSVRMANELAKRHDVLFLFSHYRIDACLDASVSRRQITCCTKTGSFAFLRNNNLIDIIKVALLIRPFAPDFSIICQPAVDFCLRGAWASKFLGIRTISYIPMCFPAQMLGLPFGAALDCMFGFYYRMFDGFITIGDQQKEYLEVIVHKTCPVMILENAVDIPSNSFTTELTSKSPCGQLRVGLVGRVEFGQKGHERAARIVALLKAKRRDFLIVVIGNGPDIKKYKALVEEMQIDKFFDFKGWIADKEEIYSMVDLILIPSDFEGVPLVMIEALLRRKMVLAHLCSGTQVIADYLSPKYLFKTDDEAVDKLCNIEDLLAQFSGEAENLCKAVESRHNPDAFRESLLEVVEDLCQ